MSRRNDAAREVRRQQLDASYAKQFDADLKNVIGTDQGRRVLGRLIFDMCKLTEAGWSSNSEIHYLAGRRRVGEELLSKLEYAAPRDTRRMVDDWLLMRYEFRTELDRAGNGTTTTDEETDDAP